MTNDEIRAIATEALEHDQAATPGPWEQAMYAPCALVSSRQRSMSLLGIDSEGMAIVDHCADAAAIAHARTAAPALARYVLAQLAAAPPLTLASALGSEEFAEGTHRIEWCVDGHWWYCDAPDGVIEQQRWADGLWWDESSTGFLASEMSCAARLVPLDADLDPATRGPLTGGA